MIAFQQIAAPAMACFLATLILVPLSIKFSVRIGAVDYPGDIKIHSRPIPRAGGLAIFAGMIIALPFLLAHAGAVDLMPALLVLGGATGVFALGLVDDVRSLSAELRMIVQSGSVLGAVAGLAVLFPGQPAISFVFIFFFVLSYTNAFNLIDGMDGLAAGVAIFAAAGLLAIALLAGHTISAIGAVAILCVSVAFLLFNHNPASVFLGDCGSTLLGFAIAVAISGSWLASGNKLTIVPLLLLGGIPILDTVSVILRRLMNQLPLFGGDRNHLYDLVSRRGFSIKQTVLSFYLAGLLLAIAGVAGYILVELN